MPTPFLQMLQHLRRQEEVMLYGDLLEVSEAEKAEALAFLAEEYEAEVLDYPYAPPSFDGPAALWGAATVYTAAQLLLYRHHEVKELSALLPPYPGAQTPGAILSADLTLRFLPPILQQLRLIDPEDELIGLLENHLLSWHYSGIGYPLPAEKLNFEAITGIKCLHQLYINRIIEHKNEALARHEVLKAGVLASLGIHKDIFWKALEL